MASKEIHIIATLQAKPGKLDEVAALFAETAKKVHASEPNTLAYYSIKPKKGDELFVVERYKDAASLQAHGGSETFKAFSKAVGPLLAAPLKIQIGPQIGGFRRESNL
ncbi:hypothetical protein FQN55_000109 [Onygenales sp. PD_40]|nr:hypothetical protein FQN55_000109 [Onygenales sp. PD_40]